MSVRSSLSKSRVLIGLLVVLAVSLVSSPAFAQSDSNPKYDVFVGYQYLHPGGTVPTPGGDPGNPTPFKLPDLAKGGGVALTYNFDPHWGLEFDYGSNAGNSNPVHYEDELSVGPRFMLRTTEANFFLHSLVSWNKVKVSGLNSSNGIGAVIGGGMDLPLWKGFQWRLFGVDYVWARQNYADFADAQFPDLRRPSFNGVRLRTGVVFSWGGAEPVAPAAVCSVQPNTVMVGEPITATVYQKGDDFWIGNIQKSTR